MRGKIGNTKHVRVLPNATNIIVSVPGLNLLGYAIVIRDYGRSVKLANTYSGAVNYGDQAVGVYWIHLILHLVNYIPSKEPRN